MVEVVADLGRLGPSTQSLRWSTFVDSGSIPLDSRPRVEVCSPCPSEKVLRPRQRRMRPSVDRKGAANPNTLTIPLLCFNANITTNVF